MFSSSARSATGSIFVPFLGGCMFGGIVVNYKREHDKPKVKGTVQKPLYKYGKPGSPVCTREYKGHSLAYDKSRKVPVWVMETLTKQDESSGEEANRKKSIFQPDPTIPDEFSSVNKDYLGSGWSRGHMAAAGNYRHSQESMDDTFYLTNIVPQNFQNNENYWYRLENYCRRLVKKYDEVTVISGPLYLNHTQDDKNYVKYQVLGEGNVAVPTHLYKIVLAENKDNGPPLLGSFVIPNEPVEEKHLKSFKTPIEDIEKWTGTRYLQLLQKHKCRDLCDEDGCNMMNYLEYMKIHYTRRIPNAREKAYLNKLWEEMKSKGVEPDKELIKAYEKRLRELENISEQKPN